MYRRFISEFSEPQFIICDMRKILLALQDCMSSKWDSWEAVVWCLILSTSQGLFSNLSPRGGNVFGKDVVSLTVEFKVNIPGQGVRKCFNK